MPEAQDRTCPHCGRTLDDDQPSVCDSDDCPRFDAQLDPVQLADLYDHDQHPRLPRAHWRDAVARDETLLGYWAWVHHQLTAEPDYLHHPKGNHHA